MMSERSLAIGNKNKYYNTKKPCKNGHFSNRRTSNGRCLECEKIQKVEWRASNYQKNLEADRKWAKNNQDKVKATDERYRKNNPEKVRAKTRRWYKKNASKIALRYKTDPGYRLKRQISCINRRKREKERSDNTINSKSILELLVKQNSKCIYCLSKLEKFHIDHIVSLAKDGQHSISNIQLLYADCNKRKSDKDPEIFANEIGRLI